MVAILFSPSRFLHFIIYSLYRAYNTFSREFIVSYKRSHGNLYILHGLLFITARTCNTLKSKEQCKRTRELFNITCIFKKVKRARETMGNQSKQLQTLEYTSIPSWDKVSGEDERVLSALNNSRNISMKSVRLVNILITHACTHVVQMWSHWH